MSNVWQFLSLSSGAPLKNALMRRGRREYVAAIVSVAAVGAHQPASDFAPGALTIGGKSANAKSL